jgi:HlyD family secretion protein
LVESRELRQTVVSSGQVMPPAEVSLESLITSNIVEIAKREGDEVKAGELLLRLDDRELNAAIAQAEAAVEQAKAGKSSIKATTLPQTLETLSQIRANLGQARAELVRNKKLFEAGVITKSALESADNAVRIYESQEKAADLQVRSASPSGSSSLTASAAIAVAEAQLAAAKVTRERTRILAPMDGVITSRFVELGETVRPGLALLVLTARGRTRILLEPDERNLALLAKGQRAVVSAEAFPSESFEATLGYIAPAVNGERGTIEVRLDVTDPPAYLRPNMTVSVELQIQSRQNALSLPLSAVQDIKSTPWVGVLDARGKATRREIRLGLRGDERAEILEGLEAGERVVYDPAAATVQAGR